MRATAHIVVNLSISSGKGNRLIPVVSGRKLQATAPMTFMMHSTMPSVTFEAGEITKKGTQKAPILENATLTA